MRPQRSFSIICNQCAKTHLFLPATSNFMVVESEVLGTSTETFYEWDNVFSCDCGEAIGFSYLVWEYPQGCYDTQEVEIDGAAVKSHFSFAFTRHPAEKTRSMLHRPIVSH